MNSTSCPISSQSRASAKDLIRSEMRLRLRNIINENPSVRLKRNSRVSLAVEKLLERRPGLWLAYAAAADEPTLPTPPRDSVFAFPKIVSGDGESASMNFYFSDAAHPTWSKNRFGLNEPDLADGSWREARALTVRGALVPGLGFDRHLRRLGRGAGFYDRFLKDREFVKVGVGFAEQLVDEIPSEPHDVALDGLVTDQDVIWNLTSHEERFSK